MPVPTQENDSERLSAIRRYELGRKTHAGAFEGLVELAAQTCNCPIALVSIVFEDEQRFEARRGIDIDWTPLDQSICRHAILQDDILEIPDTRLDARTKDYPLVNGGENSIRFYAGAPLVTAEGVPLGTLCVLDRRPRHLGEAERRALQILAEQVMQRLELYDALRRQDVLRREVDHRVKNSLANVAILTRMAGKRVKGEEAREALAAVERRIQVMVELHADLYRADDPDAPIAMSGYLGRITAHLQNVAPPEVSIESRFEPLFLISRRASALGVLINEMASNACKHGFPDGRRGRVRLSGAAMENGRYVITCEDDGVGETTMAGEREMSGLGLRIMQASAAQLDGELTLSAGPRGYRGALEFPLNAQH